MFGCPNRLPLTYNTRLLPWVLPPSSTCCSPALSHAWSAPPEQPSAPSPPSSTTALPETRSDTGVDSKGTLAAVTAATAPKLTPLLSCGAAAAAEVVFSRLLCTLNSLALVVEVKPSFREIRIGSPFLPWNHSSASTDGSGPAVSGYKSSWKRSDCTARPPR